MTHIISMNIRGLGNASKFHCLRDLINSKDPIIFLGQETICGKEKAIKVFLRIKVGWCATTVDSNGHSGGMIAMWNPNRAIFKAYRFFGGILLSGQLRGLEGSFNIINIYAPYINRITF